MVDASGTTTYTYNNRERLTSKATPQGTLTYTYDLVGNPLTLRSSNANGASVNYAYDAVNRLQSVTDNRLTPGTTTYSYDGINNLTGALSPNGVQSTLGYNALDNPTNLTISKGGVLRSYGYTYNAAGQRLSATENNGRTVGYGYDALARLTSETIANDPNSANGTLNYSLDGVGNRLSRTSTLAAIPSATSTYNANDRLNSDSYDANGNTTSADGNSYAYNFENRIKSMNAGALTVTYDGDGNRVAKTVAGLTTKYLVDDLNPTGYAQVTEEVAGGSVQRTYTYGNALVSQNQLGSGQTSFYGSDAHGSVRLLTNNAGTVSDTYDYEAFGNLVSASGTTPNDYLYSGERFDSDLGAYHLRERDYNPQRGRFLTTDPFAGFTDLPRTLHKYLYVGADPVNYIDPSGLAETFEYHLNTVRPKIEMKIPCVAAQVAAQVAGVGDPEIAIAAEVAEAVICGCGPKGIANRGGRFGDLRKNRLPDEVPHHMPQDAANRGIGMSRGDGPALGMTTGDHAATRTFSGRGNRTMREDAGLTPRQRLAKDVRDVRSLFGSKYTRGLLEVIQYAKTLKCFVRP